jgi:nicotinamide phosphoribosyltransferase
MNFLNATLLTDFYKQSHRPQYPENTETVLSTWTPRASRMDGVIEIVNAGQQVFIKEYLMNFFNENFFYQPKSKVVSEYARIIKNTLGVANPDTKHIEELHDLGYLPLSIKSLPEGTVVPLRVPVMTIQNTDTRFFWLTNFIESLASCELWQISTSATIAREYRKLLNKAALETVGNTDFVPFQGHDFSMRGMSSLRSATTSGMGHHLSFVGTDTIPAIQAAEHYYGANVETELVGTSIPATEHSIQCT